MHMRTQAPLPFTNGSSNDKDMEASVQQTLQDVKVRLCLVT